MDNSRRQNRPRDKNQSAKLMGETESGAAEKLNREDAILEHDRHYQRTSKMAERAVQAGQVTVRTAVIVNGGAAISILAFIGGLVGQGRLSIQNISTVADSLLWFAAGIVCGVGSLGSSYLAQYSDKWGLELKQTAWQAPYVRDTRGSIWWVRSALLMRITGIVTGVLSLAFFVAGMLNVHQAITSLSS